ncbi:MAG: hypothetical protein ACI9PU_000259, partial [Ascidiaceihabitans sp.]
MIYDGMRGSLAPHLILQDGQKGLNLCGSMQI